MKTRSVIGRSLAAVLSRSVLSVLLPTFSLFMAGSALAVGTPAMVKDINPLAASSFPQTFFPLGDDLFFFASDGTNGSEPWLSDGTLGGTALLKDIWAGSSGGFNPGCPTCNAISLGGVVYFSASDGSGASQLWRSDGTTAGTVKVYAGASASVLTAMGGDVYFAGTPIGFSVAFLHRSDGTTGGTSLVTDSTFMSAAEMTAVDGKVFFPASNGGAAGTELWISDGTAGGTVLLKDLAPGSSSSYPQRLTRVGDTLFFSANDGAVSGLFKSDGTSAGTVLVKQLTIPEASGVSGRLIDVNGTAFLIADDGTSGAELWKSDGTTTGTVLVKDIYPGVGGGLIGSSLVAIGNLVYFAADDNVHGIELWKSDGTGSGTVMVKDIYPTETRFGHSYPAGLADVNGTLFFRAKASAPGGTQPWLSDGTESGTVQIATLYPADNSLAASFTQAGANIFFSATNGAQGVELWAMSSGGVIGVPDAGILPATVTLRQNHPNPFNPSTVISFDLRTAARVDLRVFDTAGRLVRTLIGGGAMDEGAHEAVWDGRDDAGSAVASGVYIYRLQAGGQVEARRMVLAK